MRPLVWIALVVPLALGVTAPRAEAQPRRAPTAEAPPAAERREQIKRRIRSMRAFTLTEALALDEPTAGRLFPMLARFDDETDKLLQRRVEIQRRLRRADAMRDPRALDRLIDDAIANQRAFWDLEDKKVGELRKVLTPAQTAKLLVVLPALERKIQNQLRRAITQRRQGAGPGPGAAAEDDDDDVLPDDAPVRPRSRREAPLAPRGGTSNAPGNTAPAPPCDPSTGPCR
jgi:hypothetical protein